MGDRGFRSPRIGPLSCPFFRRTAGIQYAAFSTENGGTALQGAEKPFLCTRSGRLSRRCASPCPPRANHWPTSHLTCNTVRTIVSHLAAPKPRPALAERERRPPTQAVLGGSRPGPRGSPLSTVDRAQIHGGQGPIHGGPRPSLPGPPWIGPCPLWTAPYPQRIIPIPTVDLSQVHGGY